MANLYARIGRRLAQLRGERGMTQEELAHRAGLDASYLARIERGKRRPTLETLAALAAALRVALWQVVADSRLPAAEQRWKEETLRLVEAVEGLDEEDVRRLVELAERLRRG